MTDATKYITAFLIGVLLGGLIVSSRIEIIGLNERSPVICLTNGLFTKPIVTTLYMGHAGELK